MKSIRYRTFLILAFVLTALTLSIFIASVVMIRADPTDLRAGLIVFNYSTIAALAALAAAIGDLSSFVRSREISNRLLYPIMVIAVTMPIIIGRGQMKKAELATEKSKSESLIVSKPQFETFQRIIQVAEMLEWDLVTVNPGKGLIEAVDTSKIFGLKDDIQIRVQAFENKTQVDISTIPRVHNASLGANTDRLRFFIDRLKNHTR